MKKEKPYDPKLRQAAEEFKALCQKYDCAGFVLFVSPTHSEFVNEYSPSWSVARPEPPNRIRFKAHSEDYPSKEAHRDATRSTAHIFTSMVEYTQMMNGTMRGVLAQLNQVMRVMWTAWGERPESYPGDGK